MGGIRRVMFGTACLVLFAVTGFAESKVGFLGNDSNKVTISGNGSIMIGEIMTGVSTSGNGEGGKLDHAWIETPTLDLGVKADFNEYMRLLFEVHGQVDFTYSLNSSLYDKEFAADQKIAKPWFGINKAEGIFTLGGNDAERYPLRIETGIFEYKYNPEVRNLGEYLFRASAYPVYFVNWYDGPFYRMAGLRAATHPFDWLNFDCLLFSEMYQLPLRDFSLAGVATFTIGKYASLGLGCDLNRLFSVNSQYTTPPWTTNADSRAYQKDTIGFDSLSMQTVYSTKSYTFQSTKIAARATLDLKSFLPFDIFGKEDLKVYGEFAILGVQDYHTKGVTNPAYYDTISQRIPIMFGINLPTFKILDVLSLEFEHLKTPYLSSSYYVFNKGSPVPVTAAERNLGLAEWHWSVYAKRTIGAFSLMTQFARDHYIANNNNLTAQEQADVMPENPDWWWSFKVGYGF